jgi:hypothetical protein
MVTGYLSTIIVGYEEYLLRVLSFDEGCRFSPNTSIHGTCDNGSGDRHEWMPILVETSLSRYARDNLGLYHSMDCLCSTLIRTHFDGCIPHFDCMHDSLFRRVSLKCSATARLKYGRILGLFSDMQPLCYALPTNRNHTATLTVFPVVELPLCFPLRLLTIIGALLQTRLLRFQRKIGVNTRRR